MFLGAVMILILEIGKDMYQFPIFERKQFFFGGEGPDPPTLPKKFIS